MSVPVDTFYLDPDMPGTLQLRIQQLVAEGILTGRLRRGDKLPSSRKLAAHLGVSRITVTLAYNELLANDYLESRDRSGYFVSRTAPEPPAFPHSPQRADVIDWTRILGRRATNENRPQKPLDWSRYRYPFIYGQTDPSLFDHTNWRQCALRSMGQKDFFALTADYYDHDDPKLIEYIMRHTLPRRGIRAAPNEILLTMGAQNALWLSAQVLLTQRRVAVVENPSYHALQEILQLARCHITPIDVDHQGLPPEALPEAADVIFTTPSHQSPTNATMPLARRKALLAKAAAMNALIIEDDYEFEMSFLAPPSPALKSLDRDGRVIYVGSFSKSIFPGLRLGYLVGPAPFIDEVRALRANVLRHPPGLVQRTTAYFLLNGHYDAQINRMGQVYAGRRRVMEEALAKHNLTVAGRGVFGGSSFWMRAPDHVDTRVLEQVLRPQGVLIEPGHVFFHASQQPQNYYRIAYSSVPAERIPDGIALIADAIKAV